MYRVLLLLACLPLTAHALDYRVELEVPSELDALLRGNLDLYTLQQDEALTAQDLDSIVAGTPAEARALLETEGYFGSEVKVSRDGDTVRVQVSAGAPVIVSAVDVTLQGPVRQQADYSRFLSKVMEDWALPEGAVFRQDDWDNSKKAALRPFLLDRFPQAKISASQVRIDPASRQARVTLTVDSGPLIRFGDFRIDGLQRYPASIVSGMADFAPGAPYAQPSLVALQAALENDPHFTGVVVAPLWEQLQDDTVPLGITLSEQQRQKLEVGLNYSTGDGAGTRLGYEHYNLLRRGYTGSVAYDWKKSRQQLDLGLGFARGGDGYAHSLNLQQRHAEQNLTVTDATELGLFRVRQRDNIEARFGVEYLIEREQIEGEATRDNKALILSYGWAQRAVDNPLRPGAGYLLEGNLSGAGLAADTRFLRAYGRGALYWSPRFMRGTWLTRLELGQVWADDALQVPASRLFKAGGVGSVRGYDYQSLGIVSPDSGAITGGRVLATATLEYQYPLTPAWRLAAFVDAGDAADSWQSWRLARAQGLGVRWLSPLAPLAFDIAYGARDQRWRWNLNLGLAF